MTIGTEVAYKTRTMRSRHGEIDDSVTHPDGVTFYRVDDFWLPADRPVKVG